MPFSVLPHVSAWHTASVPAHNGAPCKSEPISSVKNYPPDNFWFYTLLTIGSRELFHLQKVLELSKMRLNDKVSALCGVRQRALPFWNSPPFGKGGRKLLFRSNERVLKLQFRTKSKWKTVSSFKLVTLMVQRRAAKSVKFGLALWQHVLSPV